MSHEKEIEGLPVEDLAHRCAQETDLYFSHKEFDSSYCFELFRRAICNKDEPAWKAVMLQYEPLVVNWVDRWISRHPNISLFHEETQDFVAQAFERFWISFTAAKLDQSQNLAAVLRYLQMCAVGAATDAWRKLHRLQIEQEAQDEEQEFSEADLTPEEVLQNEEFWRLIRKKAKDEKEYTVIYASFYLAFTPREILVEYPSQFASIREIYQYKANFLERLERDDDIKGFFQGR